MHTINVSAVKKLIKIKIHSDEDTEWEKMNLKMKSWSLIKG